MANEKDALRSEGTPEFVYAPSMSGFVWLAPLEPDQEWEGVSGCVLACLEGHRFGAWATDEGASCPDCGGTLRIEEPDS